VCGGKSVARECIAAEIGHESQPVVRIERNLAAPAVFVERLRGWFAWDLGICVGTDVVIPGIYFEF